MENVTYKVMVRKTIQVKQCEPTVIELATEGTCPANQRAQHYDMAFKEIKAKMKELFGETPSTTPGCLG